MHSPPSIVRMIRPRRMTWIGHEGYIREIRNAEGSGEKT
jgi:hypothetical protein